MVKRKRGEYSEYYTGATLWNTAIMGLLALGLCSLLLISVGAMWQWVVEGQRHVLPAYNSYNSYTFIRPTNPPQQIGMLQNNTQPNTNLATILPEGAKLMLATTSGDLFGNEANGAQFDKTALHGEDITIAPDGKTFAYIRADSLYITVSGVEKAVVTDGDVMLPAWDVSGKRLAFVSREAAGDSVYRVALNSLQPEKLLTVPEIVAPPLTNPATGRLLIVEKLGTQNTAFYTIDANCATQASCEESRRDIATIKYSVNWADYHPNAASIVFSDMDDGNLYLLATGSAEVRPLVTHQGYKRRPAFNSDGTWLAYTNVTDGNRLYLFHLTDNTMRIVPFTNVASVDWAN